MREDAIWTVGQRLVYDRGGACEETVEVLDVEYAPGFYLVRFATGPETVRGSSLSFHARPTTETGKG